MKCKVEGTSRGCCQETVLMLVAWDRHSFVYAFDKYLWRACQFLGIGVRQQATRKVMFLVEHASWYVCWGAGSQTGQT